MTNSSNKERVLIFDTTLRDGEQCPGASMTAEEKVRIAQMLDVMGVDCIEAGFPVASRGDFEGVRQVARVAKNARVCGLARAKRKDIETSAQALREAQRPRIHTFISTSPVHMKHKLKMTPEAVCEAITDSVSLARSLCDDVEWSPEDATRTEHDFLCRSVELAIKAGASTINIPDTVGYSVPEEFGALIAMLRERVPNIDQAVLSVHCHNDLGLAVANSLAGVVAGARQVECTVNGIGERAGNAAMEEVVMGLQVRGDKIPFVTHIQTEMILKASNLVSSVTSFPVQFNKAIVGKNAFAHESGIHQDGMLKHTQTYEIMVPESVGWSTSNLVMGKHSGRHAFQEKLKDLGFVLSQEELDEAFERFKKLGDEKKLVFDDDIAALVDSQIGAKKGRIRLVSMSVSTGLEEGGRASITLSIDGEEHRQDASGNGAVNALFNAIKLLVPCEPSLKFYQVQAVTRGADAQAEVNLRLEEKGHVVTGRGVDVDTLVASGKAYVNALNRLMVGVSQKGRRMSGI